MFTRFAQLAKPSHVQSLRCLNSTFMAKPVMFAPMRQFSANENEIIELVEGKVFEILKSAAKCKHDKLARTAFFEDLGFDSLDGVELVLAMEEHFGFDITNQEAEKIITVLDAIQIFHDNYVKRMAVTTQDEQ